MIMKASTSKLALTTHILVSVGWLGAVAASLALGMVGLAARDTGLVRAAYQALEPIGWAVLVPLSIASLLTGLVQSLGTRWGLFRHYWVVAKLLLNLLATAVLLLYMQTLGDLAALARTPQTTASQLQSASVVVHAGGALVLLILATVLSVYKPRGVTSYGRRRRSSVVGDLPA